MKQFGWWSKYMHLLDNVEKPEGTKDGWLLASSSHCHKTLILSFYRGQIRLLPSPHKMNSGQKTGQENHLAPNHVSAGLPRSDDDDAATSRMLSESSPLLIKVDSIGHYQAVVWESTDEVQAETVVEATPPGDVCVTWQTEAKYIASSSASLLVTLVLQYSINVASVFSAGRIGKVELGAVACVTCLAPFMGLATSLDTLCAQAYGDGRNHLVGIQCQRMVVFLSLLSLPVAALWAFSEGILLRIIDDGESARLASLYLRVMISALPGIILFEAGKRLLQAQGLFKQTTYVLLLSAPVNIFLNWLLVWKLDLGFVGAPIAVALSRNLLAILLILYIKLVNGYQCWGGLSLKAFSNWRPMVDLALPGMVMVAAEWLIFDIITFLSSRFGTDYLAAQSILVSVTTLIFHLPFAVSVAASTRVANLIGAGLVDTAKAAAKVIPLLLTRDASVIMLTAQAMPLVALEQFFDSLCTGAHGLLRGIGKQSIGGPVNLIGHYLVSLPLCLILGFHYSWKLAGLWGGIAAGLMVVSLIEYGYLLTIDWHVACEEAEARNTAG
ncbi:MATE efflux family protein subfamily [Metarhizium acridum CQMa 102]|uniref:MATE efflux family protein subfamily n=1 Tax=Metarhizium acridum (strain CQMa 102) TaxID=655827 RepID=E9E9U5_METAQ|nr:MATE efflux family protein subfamily [Metarhizium acridum CQMa 102]EFY87296.1 MATE efflux family protein subfamily [Metarhizium acridum CQMa 102]